MHTHSYIYSINYDIHNEELCKLESRQIFGEEEQDNLLLSNLKLNPSISPFIRSRFELILSATDYSGLLEKIKQKNIHVDGFKVEYLVLSGDPTKYADRLSKLKDTGYCIEGDPDYTNPSITYAIGQYKNTWYFGVLTKHQTDWLAHKKKPCSFSSAINMDIAKALVGIASKGDQNQRMLDACCGVGTVMLEACIAGFDIEGCDINWKACRSTRANLAHYNYTAKVYRSDVKDLTQQYDTAIIDLPYNLYTSSNDASTFNIIESTAKLAPRVVIVSTVGIETHIRNSGLKVSDSCTVEKKGKKFARNIWVCERM